MVPTLVIYFILLINDGVLIIILQCCPSSFSGEGYARRGFLLRRSSVLCPKGIDLAGISCGNVRTLIGEVQESCWFCSPEEQLISSGSDKAPLVLDLDPVLDSDLDPDPVLDPDLGLDPVLGYDLRGVSDGSVSLVTPVASVLPMRQFSFPPVLEDAPMNPVPAKVMIGKLSFVSKPSLGYLRRAKDREANQLHKKKVLLGVKGDTMKFALKLHGEYEERLLIACPVFFEARGGGSSRMRMWGDSVGFVGFCGLAFV